MPQGLTGSTEPDRRKASLERDLADARAELAEVRTAMNRYEKTIEVPRLMEEIRAIEHNLEEIESA